jgi:hypothetical protein
MNLYRLGLYLLIGHRRVSLLVVPFTKSTHTWKFWKYKKISPVDLYNFIFQKQYVFWVACSDNICINNSILPLIKNETVWISVCYTDWTGDYLYKFFKMTDVEFWRFYNTYRYVPFSNSFDKFVGSKNWIKYGF